LEGCLVRTRLVIAFIVVALLSADVYRLIRVAADLPEVEVATVA
jgi:hypothetical protein